MTHEICRFANKLHKLSARSWRIVCRASSDRVLGSVCARAEAACCHDAPRLHRRELIHREPKSGWLFFNDGAVTDAGIETLPCLGAMRLMGLHHHTDQLMTINLLHQHPRLRIHFLIYQLACRYCFKSINFITG